MKPIIRQPELRHGFTLVELLLVISIIAVLSSLALVVIGQAQDDARRSATQGRIGLIHNFLLQRMENYESARIPYDVKSLVTDVGNLQLVRARELRRRIVMSIINSEMPRKFANVAVMPANVGLSPGSPSFPDPQFIGWVSRQATEDRDFFAVEPGVLIAGIAANRTSEADRFVKYDGSAASTSIGDYPDGSDTNMIRTSSEYLYKILQGANDIGVSGLEVIGNSGVADTDGDGFPEVVDSWGDPIGFSIEMYDDTDRRVDDPMVDPPLVSDLDPGFEGFFGPNAVPFPTIDAGVPAGNLLLRIFSTANSANLDSTEFISN